MRGDLRVKEALRPWLSKPTWHTGNNDEEFHRAVRRVLVHRPDVDPETFREAMIQVLSQRYPEKNWGATEWENAIVKFSHRADEIRRFLNTTDLMRQLRGEKGGEQ